MVVILQQQPHQLFKRQGDDLYLTHTITPTEAKCGFSHVLKVLILHRLPSVWLYVLFFFAYRTLTVGIWWKGELYIKFDVSFPLSKKVRMETTNQISPHWPVRVITLYCLFNEWTSSVEWLWMLCRIVAEIPRKNKTVSMSSSTVYESNFVNFISSKLFLFSFKPWFLLNVILKLRGAAVAIICTCPTPSGWCVIPTHHLGNKPRQFTLVHLIKIELIKMQWKYS